jgi:hypothetical protein
LSSIFNRNSAGRDIIGMPSRLIKLASLKARAEARHVENARPTERQILNVDSTFSQLIERAGRWMYTKFLKNRNRSK